MNEKGAVPINIPLLKFIIKKTTTTTKTHVSQILGQKYHAGSKLYGIKHIAKHVGNLGENSQI